ncbi:MAG: FAD-dependent oxidoreductase [Gammaproteobacteria bacterium]|nr:FAD-dependent oxidoreductase [Gammaproteobacteria bacterium]
MKTPVRTGHRLGSERISFRFDGKTYQAYAGDTAASALLAAGTRLFGRSVKYHRPRGLLSAGFEEPNALLTNNPGEFCISNLPAPCLTLKQDMQIVSQNRWPSLHYDLAAVFGVFGGLFSAGFYYRTFMWPKWHVYEGIIRRLAGLGATASGSKLEPPGVEHIDCDVLITGAGPAGLVAALAAARGGARTVICEREPVPGGELEFEDAVIDGHSSHDWIRATTEELQAHSVRILTETAVVGSSGQMVVAHREPGGLADKAVVYRIHSGAFVAATGAIEQPIAFVDNDLPGVMLLGAAERYLARYGVCVGQNVVLFGCHDRLYTSAQRLIRGGMSVVAIVDTRLVCDAPERTSLEQGGVACLGGHAVVAALGGRSLNGVRIAALDTAGVTKDIACDSLLVSAGWTPDYYAALHSASGPISGLATATETWSTAAGAANGLWELEEVIADGRKAGIAAASRAGVEADDSSPLASHSSTIDITGGDPQPEVEPFWRSPTNRKGEKRQFVDLQNDVTVADLRQSLEQGFCDIEHVKRFTALGFGTEQGRTGAVMGAAILAELSGKNDKVITTSRRRPPFKPATLGVIAAHRQGLSLRPERRTALHALHLEQGGVMEDTGRWQRPRYYSTNGSDAVAAGLAEAARVRASGGILDGSTLGKIEVAGPGAAAFLDHIYLTRASTIKPGRSKYMVMLREDGMALDDGVVMRLEPERFLATVGSGHAGHVLSHLEFHRDLEKQHPRYSGVVIADATEAWSVIVVAGPRSREVLCQVLGSVWQDDLQPLAHMGFIAGQWQNHGLRVLRASFSGELAYELHCQAAIAGPLWQALSDADMLPYGLEALEVLRVEKGYLTSAELNGQTTPQDLGMGRMVGQGNPCVGRALLDRPGLHSPQHPCLVGLRASQPGQEFLTGAQVTTTTEPNISCGHVTSATFSPALGEWIALALVARQHSEEGTPLLARDPLRGGDTAVKTVSPVHFDPLGERMKA